MTLKDGFIWLRVSASYCIVSHFNAETSRKRWLKMGVVLGAINTSAFTLSYPESLRRD